MRPITATVTPAVPQSFVRLDNFATAVLGLQIVCLGGAQFALLHSFDDPSDPVNPIPLGSMAWDNSLLSGGAAGGFGSGTYEIMSAPLWFSLHLLNSQGSVRATFLQVGEHSHSNISKGKFAPSFIGGTIQTFGTNFGAMGK